MHLVKPIMQIREVVSTIKGAFHIVRSSLLTYFMQDDNTVFSVESEPEIMIELMPTKHDTEGNDKDLFPSQRLLGSESVNGKF